MPYPDKTKARLELYRTNTTVWINHSYKTWQTQSGTQSSIKARDENHHKFLKSRKCLSNMCHQIHAPPAECNIEYYTCIGIYKPWLVPYNIAQMHDSEPTFLP